MEELFTVLQLAKTHQAAISAALQGFETERAALARERLALMQTAATLPIALRDAAGEVSTVTEGIVPALQNVGANPILTHRVCGPFLGLVYIVNPKLSRYSIGLR